MKKASEVFKNIRFAKLDPKHEKSHAGGSTDDEEHYAVGEKEFNQQVAHAKKRAMQEETLDEVSSDLVKKARDAAFTKGKEDQGHRFVRKAYEKGQKESEAMAKKINEVSNDLLQRYKKKAGEQVDNPATPSATKLKRGVGHLRATSKQMTSGKPMPKESVEIEEEMDYNVKVSHSTESGEVAHKVYKVAKAKDHRHAQNIALNKHTAALDKAGTKFKNATASVVKEENELQEGENKQVKGGDPCWKGYEMVGKKKKNGREVPNCVPVKEAADGTPFEGGKPATKRVIPGKHGAGYSTARHLARMALKKQQEKMKPLKKVNESKKAEIVKRIAKKNVSDDKFQPEPELNSRVQKVNDVDPFINK